MLEGDNKYACSICNEKTEATKGCRFNSLPPILTLHLKRFDLDYETFQRKKINDRVSFPQILNLNKFFTDELVLTPQTSINVEEASADAEGEGEGDTTIPFLPADYAERTI